MSSPFLQLLPKQFQANPFIQASMHPALSQVQNVLDGDIDDFIQAYLRMKAEKMHKKT